MLPRLLRWGFNLFSALLSHREVKGLENLPPDGPYIIVINHLSYFDAPFAYGLLGGEKVTGWAAEKYENHHVFGPILRMAGGIFIQRGQVDRTGTEQAIQAWRQMRRPLLTMHIGKPFTLPALDPENRASDLRQNTDEIMCRVATLIPAQYHGYYADHPRLQELLRSTTP